VALWAKYATQWWQDPKVLGVSVEAEVLYARAIGFCKEQLSDGVVHRHALVTLGIKLTDPVAAADELVAARLWRRKGRNYTFPPATWRRWQGTSADVSQLREYEATRKRVYRSRQRQALSQRDTNGTTGQRDAEPEPEPEPEPEGDVPPKPPGSNGRSARIKAGGQAPPHPPVDNNINDVVANLANRMRLRDEA
jgi:hypothetical protein